MKRFIAIVLAIMTLSSALVAQSSAATSDGVHGYAPCDCNDDGVVNMKDVLLLRRLVGGAVESKEIDLLAADCNGDGAVNMKDVLYLRRVLAGDEEPETNNADGKYRVGVVSFGGRNISRYDILIPEDADRCVKNSASILSDRVRRACGIKLNTITDRSASQGYVIEYRYDAEGAYDLGTDGYRVTVDGDVTLLCGGMRGALYATYYFLEQFVGYRFLDEDVVYVYEAERVDTPDGFEDVEIPQIVYRAVSDDTTNGDNFSYLRLNAVDGSGSRGASSRDYGGGVGTLYIHAHSYAYQMAGWENAYNHKWIDEQGLHNKQPCLTDESTYEKIVDFNYNLYLERLGYGYVPGFDFTQISCSPNDNTNFCTCERCKAVYAEEGSISGTVFRLANRVAETQRETMPGVDTYTIAYWDARKPPKYTRPVDTVCVCYCFGGCNNHTYDHTEQCEEAGGNPRLPSVAWDGSKTNNTNVDDMKYFRQWCELTNNIYTWYYSCSYGYYISPSPNVLNIYNDMKTLAAVGAAGCYYEGGGGRFSFEPLRNYLASRMMWDPYMPEEEFESYLDEFLIIWYGAGWRYIKEYLYIQNRAGDLKGCWTNNFDWPWDMYDKEYFGSEYGRICALFDAAYAAAETEVERARVRNTSVHAHFLGLSASYERDFVNGDDAAREEYSRRYADLWNYMKNEAYLKDVREGAFRALSFCEMPGGLENLPKTPSDVRDTMTWLFENDYSYTGSRVN